MAVHRDPDSKQLLLLQWIETRCDSLHCKHQVDCNLLLDRAAAVQRILQRCCIALSRYNGLWGEHGLHDLMRASDAGVCPNGHQAWILCRSVTVPRRHQEWGRLDLLLAPETGHGTGGIANWALILEVLAGCNYIFCRVHRTNQERNSVSQWTCKQLLLQWIRTRCHRPHLKNSSRMQLAGRAALVPFITWDRLLSFCIT